MKVSQVVPLLTTLYTLICSSPYGRLFHHEQAHLPIPGFVHRVVEPFGKPFSDFSHFLTRAQLDLVDIAFVTANLT